MCGIAGALFWNSDAGRGGRDAPVARMVGALEHRGPDGEGIVRCATPDHLGTAAPTVILGHRRLSIIDLSDRASQPMASPRGPIWITYNGEIYNYKELAWELRSRGHRFASTGDTEVLLHAYLEWGSGCLERLNGMFAFAVWDRRRGELFCARDRFGVKPFYYTVIGGRLRFASE
ncbi:MAG TPA: hypothetical protein VF424_17820, partial [Vicinamibacterales bacterium]